MKTLLSLVGWLAVIGLSATAQAETYVFETDTIRASGCAEGDPLCDDSFVCQVDSDGGRTCETAAGWAERMSARPEFVTLTSGWFHLGLEVSQ